MLFLSFRYSLGGNLTPADFGKLMFSQPDDSAGYFYPDDGLLQAWGVVQDTEIRAPKHLDIHRQESLMVIKNGGTTGTTLGRANGLESAKRTYPETGLVKVTTLDFAVLPYGGRGKFSDAGDSGAIVLTRDGKILGPLTGGAGPTDETDISFVTPWWWLLQQIQKKFPGIHVYPVVKST